jgi:hypothetical protein
MDSRLRGNDALSKQHYLSIQRYAAKIGTLVFNIEKGESMLTNRDVGNADLAGANICSPLSTL